MTWARRRWFPKTYSGSNFYSRPGFYAVNRSRSDSLAIQEYMSTGTWKRRDVQLPVDQRQKTLSKQKMVDIARDAAKSGLSTRSIQQLLNSTPEQTRSVLYALGLTKREVHECLDLGQELPRWLITRCHAG